MQGYIQKWSLLAFFYQLSWINIRRLAFHTFVKADWYILAVYGLFQVLCSFPLSSILSPVLMASQLSRLWVYISIYFVTSKDSNFFLICHSLHRLVEFYETRSTATHRMVLLTSVVLQTFSFVSLCYAWRFITLNHVLKTSLWLLSILRWVIEMKYILMENSL